MREFALYGLGTAVFAAAAVLALRGGRAPEIQPPPPQAPAIASIAPLPPPVPPADSPAPPPALVTAAEAVPDAAPRAYVFECIQGSTTTLTDIPCPPDTQSRLIALREPNSYVAPAPDAQSTPAQSDADGPDYGSPDAGVVYGVYGWRHHVAPRRKPIPKSGGVGLKPARRAAPSYHAR